MIRREASFELHSARTRFSGDIERGIVQDFVEHLRLGEKKLGRTGPRCFDLVIGRGNLLHSVRSDFLRSSRKSIDAKVELGRMYERVDKPDGNSMQACFARGFILCYFIVSIYMSHYLVSA